MSAPIPETLPVQFTERTLYVGRELGFYELQLGGVVQFDGRIDETLMGRVMRLLIDAEPVLGCRFLADSVPPVWRRLEGLDHMKLLEVRECDEPAAEAMSYIYHPFNEDIDPKALAAIMRGPSGDTLAVRAHHLAVDGGAVKEMMYLISELYRTLGEKPDWTPEPNLDGARSPVVKAGLIETLKSLRESDLTPPDGDPNWYVPMLGGEGSTAAFACSVEPAIFRLAEQRATAAGAKVNDIILAAMYRVLWRIAGSRPGVGTPLMSTCELRKHLPAGTKTALSNMSSAWWVSVSPAADEPFDETLARVAAATQEWKRAGAGRGSAIAIGLVDRFMRKKGLDMARKMMSRTIDKDAADPTHGGIVVTNIGVMDADKLDFGPGTSIVDAWLMPPESPIGIGIGITTYRDRLHLTAGVQLEAMCEDTVTAILAGAASEIESWVASTTST